MRISRTQRSVIATGLVVLLGVLSTGLPTHHHHHAADLNETPYVDAGDHHGHATEIVELPDRVPPVFPELTLAPTILAHLSPVSVDAAIASPEDVELPTGRSPPPVVPRAPPLLA